MAIIGNIPYFRTNDICLGMGHDEDEYDEEETYDEEENEEDEESGNEKKNDDE